MASKKKGVRWSKSHDEKISALFDSGEADPYTQEVDSILEVYNNNSWIGEVYPVPHQFYSIYRAKASKYITAKEAEGTRTLFFRPDRQHAPKVTTNTLSFFGQEGPTGCFVCWRFGCRHLWSEDCQGGRLHWASHASVLLARGRW